jgi:hypothetical protein
VCLCRPAEAETDTGPIDEPLVTGPDIPIKQSYFVPAAEIIIGNLVLSLTSYAAGADWGVRESETWFEMLVSQPWELDDDAYTTNQLAHPMLGTLSFLAGRSTGHNFWVSGIYSFGSSLLWENVIENEVPSFNDMMVTPIGGMFIGEALFRFARAVRYGGQGKPSWWRRAASSVIDPGSFINRLWWGNAWAPTVPPEFFAYVGVGYQQPTEVWGNRGGGAQLHIETFLEYGLLRDPLFQPRHPFDHFEIYGDLNIGSDNLEGSVYARGLLVGDSMPRERGNLIYGLFGAYDFNNNDYVRASILGFGPGATAEMELGERGYLGGTLAAYLVPYGAAGGVLEVEGIMRDSHDGPGLAQLGEIKFGRRGTFEVRFSLRAAEIGARLVGDDANEYVVQSWLSTRLQLTRHQAIGADAIHTWQHATYDDMEAPSNRTTDFRVFYALTTDEILGR